MRAIICSRQTCTICSDARSGKHRRGAPWQAGTTTERGCVHEGRSVVSYNGEPFSGFARQNGQLTVQGNIEDALELLFRRRIDTTCAGRTDAGVHALCQVISFDLLPDEWFRRKPDSLLKSLNALTHEEISFRSVRPMPEDFSARFSAVMREYRYYICTDVAAPLLMEKFCWHLGKPLDVEAMKQASTHLLGEHDFKSFCMAVSAKDKPRIAMLPISRSSKSRSGIRTSSLSQSLGMHSCILWCARWWARSCWLVAGNARPIGWAKCSQRAIGRQQAERAR